MLEVLIVEASYNGVNVAEAVAGRLAASGVTHVFGYPGGETLALLDACRRRGLRFILTRHEATAAFAALATGELTGVPGVCLATLGPGATNLVSGVAAALLERAPLLAFTAQLPRSRYETTTHQRLDLGALFGPVTKASMRLEPDEALRSLERGMRLAVTPRPGPVHFEVPSDVPTQPCSDALGAARAAIGGAAPQPAPLATPAVIAEARRLIAGCRQPVLLLGLAAKGAAQDDVVSFAQAAGLPVVVTPKAKGLMPESHPLFVGVIEMLGTRHLTEWLAGADGFIFAGFDPVELDMLWDLDRPAVLLDMVADPDLYYRIDVEVTGDVGANLRQLAAVDDRELLLGVRTCEEGRGRAAQAREVLAGKIDQPPEPGLMSPRQIVHAVRRGATSADALATTDVGAHKMAAGQLWRVEHPGCFLMSNGQSSMGYGLPAAMAAKLMWPERQVVALIGDGGLGMYLGELETLARLGLPIPIVVPVDDQLTLIAMGQERRGYERYGVGFGAPDYVELARSLGGHGVVANDEATLREAVTTAFGRQTFTLIAAPVDERLYRV